MVTMEAREIADVRHSLNLASLCVCVLLFTLQIDFEWESPAGVDLVGSFLLRTVARPYSNVDVVVTMPASLLQARTL